MKKLLIASSVLAALAMVNVANAEPSTENGGTVEFIGEITDTTCYVDVKGTVAGTAGPTDTSNLVLLPTISKTQFTSTSPSAGRTPFFLQVHSESTYANPCVTGQIAERNSAGLPTGGIKQVEKVKAIFGGSLQAGDTNRFASQTGMTAGSAVSVENHGNVDMVKGYLNNIAAGTNTLRTFADGLTVAPGDNGAATGVQLRLLDSDLRVIKVGNVNDQIANNKATDIPTKLTTPVDASANIPYFVEYVAENETTPAVTAGMVRGYVVYDLMYE